MKYKINHLVLLSLMTIVTVMLTGCASIDESPFNDFSAAGDKITQGTQDTYTGVQAILHEKQVNYLVAQTNAPWFGDNREVLFQPYLVDPAFIEARVQMAQALAAYAKKLANLAGGPNYENFDSSTKAVADSLAGFDTNALAKLGFPATIPFNQGQTEAAANIVDDVAHLLLAQMSKNELKKYIIKNESKIDAFTELLAIDIGYGTDQNGNPDEGIRGLYYRNLYKQLEAVASKTEEWQQADEAGRKQIVENCLTQAENLRNQDASLVALRDSYKQFAVANHQLIKVMADSESFDATQAIQVLNGMVDHINALTATLK